MLSNNQFIVTWFDGGFLKAEIFRSPQGRSVKEIELIDNGISGNCLLKRENKETLEFQYSFTGRKE